MGKLGMSFQYAQFSRRLELRRRGRTPWDFTGVRQALRSMHGSRTGRFGAWSMELGRDARGHWAGIAQGVLPYSARSVRLLMRLYEPEFYAPFSSVPSAVDGLNELGVALVAEGRQGSAYADVYRRPARSYYVPFPSTKISWGGAPVGQVVSTAAVGASYNASVALERRTLCSRDAHSDATGLDAEGMDCANAVAALESSALSR